MISHGNVEMQRVPARAVTLSLRTFPAFRWASRVSAVVARLKRAAAHSSSGREKGLVEQGPKAHAGFIKLIGGNQIVLLYV